MSDCGTYIDKVVETALGSNPVSNSITSWKKDKLMKQQIDKIVSWRNSKLTNWQVNETPSAKVGIWQKKLINETSSCQKISL